MSSNLPQAHRITQPATPPAAAPTPAELMDQLARAAAAYYRHFAAMAADRGPTLMQGKTLSLLREPKSMRARADLLACDASNVTGIVDRLEARGLVRREVAPTDRRIKNVLLTEEGHETVRRIRAETMSGLTGLSSFARRSGTPSGNCWARSSRSRATEPGTRRASVVLAGPGRTRPELPVAQPPQESCCSP